MISSQLENTINDQLRWRESELAIAKLQLQRSLNDTLHFRYAYRCFVAITYAHFEAYTKRVVAQAMQDIFNSGNDWSKCVPTIQTLLFAPNLRQFLNSLSNADLASYGSLNACLIDKAIQPSLSIILDCGNMNVTNFFWAITSIGLPETNFSFARGDVGRLAALRHDCAHGELLTFDATKTNGDLARDMYALQSRIIIIMHSLAVEVLDHFKADSFLKA